MLRIHLIFLSDISLGIRFSRYDQPSAGLQDASPQMGLSGLEPPTSRLSGVRSNRLSYKPRSMSKCADTCCPAMDACIREPDCLWMHKRRSRGMTDRRSGIPALTDSRNRYPSLSSRGHFLPVLSSTPAFRPSTSLIHTYLYFRSFQIFFFNPAATCFPIPSPV